MSDGQGFFEYISGRDGEELVTAALSYLLVTDTRVRARMMALLGPRLALDLRSGDQFRAIPELFTWEEGPNGRTGRVDLALECANAILGLEMKFDAPFQDGQPEKYAQALQRRAQEVNAAYGLFLIVPEARLADARDRCAKAEMSLGELGPDPSARAQQSHFDCIKWGEVLPALRVSENPIATELEKFILQCEKPLSECVDRLTEPMGEANSQLRAGFLHHIREIAKPLLPGRVGNVTEAPGKWYGFDAYFGGTSGNLWIGLSSHTGMGLSAAEPATVVVCALGSRLRTLGVTLGSPWAALTPTTDIWKGWDVWELEPSRYHFMATHDSWKSLLERLIAELPKLAPTL